MPSEPPSTKWSTTAGRVRDDDLLSPHVLRLICQDEDPLCNPSNQGSKRADYAPSAGIHGPMPLFHQPLQNLFPQLLRFPKEFLILEKQTVQLQSLIRRRMLAQ